MDNSLILELIKRLQAGELSGQEELELLPQLDEMEDNIKTVKKQIEINQELREKEKNIAYVEFQLEDERNKNLIELHKERNKIQKRIDAGHRNWTIFAILYTLFIVCGSLHLMVFTFMKHSIALATILPILLVMAEIALIKPIAKLFNKKYAKYHKKRHELVEQINCLEKEMRADFEEIFQSDVQPTNVSESQPVEVENFTTITDEINNSL